MKHKSLFLESGYLDIEEILSYKLPFNFIIGGRGTGKTYGILKYFYEKKIRILILRRTQVQADIISTNAFHPYKKLCEDMCIKMCTKSVVKGVTAVYDITETEELEDGSEPVAYIAALSTFANLRGFDASDIKAIFIDEFISETEERPIKDEYKKFLNAYETVNRNRELYGADPVQVICAANSNSIDNPYFTGLAIVNKIYKAQRKRKQIFIDKKRGFAVFMIYGSPISSAKSNTVLYRLSSGTDYAEMALSNDFSGFEEFNIQTRPLIEYRKLFTLGEISVYQHKSSMEYYCTSHDRGTGITYTGSKEDIQRAKLRYGFIMQEAYYGNFIFFEDLGCQIAFKNLFI